jgi:hypothetical protein
LFRLFFNRQASNKRGNFFSSFPLGKLSETLLTSPYGGVDDLEEKLACTRIEDEYCTVNWFSCEVSFKSLVNCDSVDVGIIDEPNYLV